MKSIRLAFFFLIHIFVFTHTVFGQRDSLNQNLELALSSGKKIEINKAYHALNIYVQSVYDFDSGLMLSQDHLRFIQDNFHGNERDSILQEAYLRYTDAVSKLELVEEMKKSLIYADSAMILASQSNHTINQIRALINKGRLLSKLGEHYKEIEVLLNAKEIIDQSGDQKEKLEGMYLELIYLDTSVGFQILKQYQQAIDYAQMALKFHKEESDYVSRRQNLQMYGDEVSRLGVLYFFADSLDRAMEYAKEGERVFKELNHFKWELENINTQSNILKRQGKYAVAVERYYDQIKRSEANNHPLGVLLALINLAEPLAYQNKLEEALEVSKRAEVMAKDFDPYYMRNLQGNLAEIYKMMGDFENAYHHQVIYKAMEDSLVQANNLKGMNDLLLKYETSEKEKQLAEQELEIQTKNASLSARNNQVIVLVSGLGLVLLGGTLFYNRNKARQKEEMQAAIIDEKERGLEAVVQATEEERKRISKDLHDGIGQQLNALRLGLKSVENDVEGELKEKLQHISSSFSKSADEVRQISHQMMPRALMDDGLVKAIEDLLRNTFQFTEIAYEFEHHKMEERLEEKIEVSMYRILQELLSNIIKHSEASKVQVQLIRLKNKVTLLVEDNGKGFSGEQSDGHGQMNIRNRLDMIRGSVNYEPSPESGVVAVITVPLS